MKLLVAVSLIIQIVSGGRIQGSIELPGPDICGVDVIGQRILSGNDEVIGNEFPWLVLLQYRPPNGGDLQARCAGSLINQRYVLTAAHCVTSFDIGTPVSVRLGDNSTRIGTEFVTLDIEDIYYEYCRYNPFKDIALIRLKSDVSYSENIKPICLPSTVQLSPLLSDQLLTVAGWGLNSIHGRSTTKQKELVTCDSRYSFMHLDTRLNCAQIRNRNADCISDGGAPLMAYHHGVWVLQGILASGRRQCDSMSLPGIFTNVGQYDQWIKENMRPVSVRLGDNSTRIGSEFVTLDIEEIHVPEFYIGEPNFSGDFALIRLKSEVSYSENIKPICLPSTVGRSTLRDGQPLTVAGWELVNNVPSNKKQKQGFTYLDIDRCRPRFSFMHMHHNKICAQVHNMNDSCIAQSGGPLMEYHHSVWVLRGIKSLGYPCDRNMPDVFTNVRYYVYWIQDKMKP
ncbi:CLIP domain-containing serine protease 14D-like [Drosophila rhopaloa]|uniref:Coagulation factor XI-like n=1 Tax=Drosophila rhopaloa TaxID=1041015 RepID=A0A6P4E378_DRORH|nr:CLIP domain-containing serine protease 14D-like [Drosophila rhopaloa]